MLLDFSMIINFLSYIFYIVTDQRNVSQEYTSGKLNGSLMERNMHNIEISTCI